MSAQDSGNLHNSLYLFKSLGLSITSISELATEFLAFDLGFLITDNSSLLDQEVNSDKLNVACKTI